MKVILGLLAIVVAVNCQEKWWESMSLYQVYPRSFKDSDGNGVGDLKGIYDNLEHLKESNVDAFWISPVYPSPGVDSGYDIANFTDIDPIFGTLKEFDELLAKAHELGLKLLMDFVPNHSSDQHEWFKKSIKNIPPYNNYYVWANGSIKEDGTRVPPNNWVAVFGGPAWTWNEERQQFYLHQFTPQQPDLNYRDEKLNEEMKNVLRFWLNRGVDGFRIDVINHVFEIESLKDEPLSGHTNDPNNYGYLDHIYTKDQPECYELVRQFREVLDEYKVNGEGTRIMVLEAYVDLQLSMMYYEAGATFPFNFWFIEHLNGGSSAKDYKQVIDNWMSQMPAGSVANWVVGNHDKKRIVSRYGAQRAQGTIAVILTLPGAGITYYGDEIGMPDNYVSWEEGRDPQGCNAGKEHFEEATRDTARTPFLWDDSVAAGFSTNASTWLPVNPDYKTFNLKVQKSADDSEYKFYMALSELRKWPAVRRGDLYTYLINDKLLATSRTLKNERSVYVLLNFDSQPQTVDLTSKISDLPDELVIYRTTLNSGLTYGSRVSPKAAHIPAEAAVIYVTPQTSHYHVSLV